MTISKLDNKIAVVAGGNSGIGLATAKRFAAEGATVIITGRRQEATDEAVASIGEGVSGNLPLFEQHCWLVRHDFFL